MNLLRCRVRQSVAFLFASPALIACSEGLTAPVIPQETMATLAAPDAQHLDGFESGSAPEWTTWSASGAWAEVAVVSPGALGTRHALRATYSAASTALVQREYGSPRDWSDFAHLEFQFHGTASGNAIRLEIKDNGASSPAAELFEYRFVDDFTGWRTFRVAFDRFARRRDWQPDGAPNDGFNRTAVWGYRFQPLGGNGRFLLDEIRPAGEPTAVAPLPAAADGCSTEGALRVVDVATASQLFSALAAARAGDLIRLADGVYPGSFRATTSGTAANPIRLCGTPAAVLRGGTTSSGYGFFLSASHWRLHGFTVTNSQFGIYLEGASQNVLDGLTVRSTGQEAIRFRSFSSDNVLRNSRISDTGLLNAEYGEGVYIGSWKGHWSESGGRPDASDRNRILDNVFGPNVRAEHIDAKEGTTGGVIRGNTFDGRGMVRSQSWVDSWVELKGNGYMVEGNEGVGTIADGFQVFVELQGWGIGNVFRNNSADLGGAPGFGFRIDAPASANVVECGNRVRNAAGGLANVPCR